jgi:hypothetical protein
MKMSAFLLAMFLVSPAWAQQPQPITNTNMALQSVRQTYHVWTGLEIPAADEANSSPLIFDPSSPEALDMFRIFDRTTGMAFVFRALVAQRPVYTWNFQDGVYDVYPKADSLSELQIASVVLTNVTALEAADRISQLPEVTNWLARHRAVNDGMINLSETSSGTTPVEPQRISLTLTNLPLRSVLNQVIAKFGRDQWMIGHVATKGQYAEYISIRF